MNIVIPASLWDGRDGDGEWGDDTCWGWGQHSGQDSDKERTPFVEYVAFNWK